MLYWAVVFFVIAIIAFLFELAARLTERVLVPWAAHR